MKSHVLVLILISIGLFFGCGEKKTSEKQPLVDKEPHTLKPYKEPLADSILSRSLSHAYSTPDSLGRAIINALIAKDSLSLINLTINQNEYLNWIWPEEPSSDPKFNIPLDFAWENLNRDSYMGLKKVFSRYAGKDLELVSMKLLGEKIKHQTYTYHRDPELKIKYADGSTDVIHHIGTIVEMNNKYKVLFYKKD